MTKTIQVGDTYRDRDSGKEYKVTSFNGNSVLLTKEEMSLAVIPVIDEEVHLPGFVKI
ncbi:hypothetical protein SAMN05421781_0528 [Marinococcus luteus]|uniref:Uncharacterized protein n=1 Tax=Marinococcus luteus TaxID=1122204 RepID=A0A1H2QZ43_9BACI|nr:hypothetical protein [Marinococcus luteus]SDW12482.1 hypothetical protein SAMN05421781_0528 [Marinococcus luteus]